MTTQTQPLILTVSQLTQAIKLQLEGSFPLTWVKGEVSNLKLHTSGHLYFSIKDAFAQISCVAFRQDLLKIPILPKIGDQVLIRGELNVWLLKGTYQLIVRELSHVGRGEQLLKLEILKQKLQALGLFSLERKRALPQFPKKIGIVTSPTGAVIQDIINVLSRRLSGFHLLLNPVRVQGEGAAEEIAQAIEQFNAHNLVDIIVVCRGGGSIEDLAPFNTELVAQAIYKSQIPVVSAVGHETDVTISDLVADVRAPTPSAAAELISTETEELLKKLQKAKRTISHVVYTQITYYRQQLSRLSRHPLFTTSTALLISRMQQLDVIREDIDLCLNRQLAMKQQELSRLQKRVALARPSERIRQHHEHLFQLHNGINAVTLRYLNEKRKNLLQASKILDRYWIQRAELRKKAFEYPHFEMQIPFLIQKQLAEKKKNLLQIIGHLESLHPKKLLKKGYSILFSQKDGSIISSVTNAYEGQKVRIVLADGELEATITRVPHD